MKIDNKRKPLHIVEDLHSNILSLSEGEQKRFLVYSNENKLIEVQIFMNHESKVKLSLFYFDNIYSNNGSSGFIKSYEAVNKYRFSLSRIELCLMESGIKNNPSLETKTLTVEKKTVEKSMLYHSSSNKEISEDTKETKKEVSNQRMIGALNLNGYLLSHHLYNGHHIFFIESFPITEEEKDLASTSLYLFVKYFRNDRLNSEFERAIDCSHKNKEELKLNNKKEEKYVYYYCEDCKSCQKTLNIKESAL